MEHYYEEYIMTSGLNNIYENQNDSYIYNESTVNDYDIDTPIGWSSICFDETINYYTDCNNKNLSIINEN